MALFAGVEYAIVPSDIKDPTLRKINADSRRVARSKGNRLKLSKITPNDFRVHLEDRGFAKFPEAVLRDNSKLRGLFLSRNTLKVIPSGIIKLKMLQKLVLSGNCLLEVPKEVGSLVYLESLWLDHNQLDTIPVEIGKLVKLKELNLDANPLSKGLSKGPKTFSEVWRGKEQNESLADGSKALQHERTPLHVLGRKTQATIQYLRDNMPQDMLSVVQKREKKVKQRVVKRQLREACKHADLQNLRKLHEEAAGLGVQEDDLAQASHALKILTAMDAAVNQRDLSDLRSTIKDWSSYCKSFNFDRRLGHGPDLDRATKTRKSVEKEQEREVWKTMELSKSRQPTPSKFPARLKQLNRLSPAMQIPDFDKMTPMGQAKSFTLLRLTKKISFNEWVNRKAEADKMKGKALNRMRKREVESSLMAKQERILNTIKQAELENKWPSRIVEAYPAGYFNPKMKRTLSALPHKSPTKQPPTYSETTSPWPVDDENANRGLHDFA